MAAEVTPGPFAAMFAGVPPGGQRTVYSIATGTIAAGEVVVVHLSLDDSQ